MAKNKLTIDFKGFDVLKNQLEKLGGNVKEATEEALKKSEKIVEQNLIEAMNPHNRTHDTEKSIIRNPPVEWTGETATVNVGFDLENGGMPSVYLMYGTTLHGQPHIAPDQKLYDAIYGAAVKKEIKKIQEQIFKKAIEEVMK